MAPENDFTTLRTCTGCGIEKTLDNFPLARGKRYFRCRSCKNAANVVWHASNRERSREIKRAYIERHPESNHAAKLKYSRSSRGAMNIKQWKIENREHINARYREQYASDPTPFLVRHERRNRFIESAPGCFNLSEKCAMLESQSGLCNNPLCRADLSETGYHADHMVPLVRGGSHDAHNRQLLCPRCNCEKGTMTQDEWSKRLEIKSA